MTGVAIVAIGKHLFVWKDEIAGVKLKEFLSRLKNCCLFLLYTVSIQELGLCRIQMNTIEYGVQKALIEAR